MFPTCLNEEEAGLAADRVDRTVAVAGEREPISEEKTFFVKWKEMLRKAGGAFTAFTKTGKPSAAGIDAAVKNTLEDVREWLEKNPEFSDYYEKDLQEARDIATKSFPELKNDGEWKMFPWHMAIASNNTRLPDNISEIIALQEHLRTGKPLNITFKPKPTWTVRLPGGKFITDKGGKKPRRFTDRAEVKKIAAERGGEIAPVKGNPQMDEAPSFFAPSQDRLDSMSWTHYYNP